ncbi:MAG: NAD-dependent epimerase/dehydratase family protein [Pseudomonadota bacterium]
MTPAKRVLVTGATGFVGTQLCTVLEASGCKVRRAVRYPATSTSPQDTTVVGEIDSNTRWEQALRGIDSIVHLAARVHVLNDSPLNEHAYIESNAQGTRRLAEAAAGAGIGRMVFLSSIKVNGEESGVASFTSADAPRPVDAYGRSKLLAENYLRETADRAGMEAVIVRAPLVYGPGVRANFLRLMRWIDRGIPLPFGSVHNRRSLVSIWNLCDLLTNLVTNPRATGQVWLACDGEQLSTPDLIRRIAAAMQRKAHLWRVPVPILRAAAALAGKSAEINRLCGSLTIDPRDAFTQLGWAPPMPMDEALARTVTWYLAESVNSVR